MPSVQHSLLETTKQIISYNTVSDQSNLDCIHFIANRLEPLGFDITLHEHTINHTPKANIIARIGPKTADGIIISGHTDVVPFANQPGWQTDALTLTEKAGKLFGRGTADMKTFIAQCLDASQAIDFKNIKKSLVYIFTCDEEVCCQGSGRLVQALPQLLPNEPLPHVAWIGEPTDFMTYVAHKGFVNFTLTIKSPGGHSSRPDLGVNAIELMGEVIAIIKELNQTFAKKTSANAYELYPDFPHAHMNLGKIQGGLADNMIAESCQMSFSLRMTTEMQQEIFFAELQQIIKDRLNIKREDVQLIWKDLIQAPAMLSDRTYFIPQLLEKLTEQPIQQGAPYATDGGQLALGNIQSFICGPASLAQAHQPNEYISLEHLYKGRQLVEKVIQHVCFE